MYDLTQDLCEAAGMPRYEVSNHSAPDAQSRHNLIYWRYGDYAGIGPGAHGRLTHSGSRFATEAVRNPGAWLAAIEKETPDSSVTELTPREQAEEYLMMGLRVIEGIDLDRFALLCGSPVNPVAVERLVDIGMAQVSEGRLFVTDQGFKVLNAVILDLLREDAD
jgi:oxygen-independent coproporphyrinogen-3 oxidase